MDTTRFIISTIIIFGVVFIGAWALFWHALESAWKGFLVAFGIYVVITLIGAGITALTAWTYNIDFWSVFSG